MEEELGAADDKYGRTKRHLNWMEDDLSWKLGEVVWRALFKNLIRPLLVLDRKDEGSGDLMSQSSVHADARNGEATIAAQ